MASFLENIAAKLKDANPFSYVTESIGEIKADNLFIMGRPCDLPEKIDRHKKVSNFLRSKMTLIDLLPCTTKINLTDGLDSQKDLMGIKPELNYDDAIAQYTKECVRAGLKPKMGIRLYTTDDTQASDAITNSRGGKNFFQGLSDKVQNVLSPAANFFASTGFANTSIASGAVDLAADAAQGLVDIGSTLTGIPADLQSEISNVTNSLVESIGDAAINGYRYSFPTIWSDSSYRPNLTSNIKLVSPYGHPKAIRKFIIEPLMYLLLLTSPKTKDGMAYGRPFSLTVSAYGMSHVPIANISSISIRRGGSSTSFNLYRQPIELDIT